MRSFRRDTAPWTAALEGGAAVWHDRDGRIWMSGVGRIHSTGDDDYDEDAQPDEDAAEDNVKQCGETEQQLVSDAAGRSKLQQVQGKDLLGQPPSAAKEAGAKASVVTLPASSAWYPFVSFLAQRRKELRENMMELAKESQAAAITPLITHAMEYVPQDVASLVGLGQQASTSAASSGASGSAPSAPPAGNDLPQQASQRSPLLLHADINANNLLLWWEPAPATDAPGSSAAATLLEQDRQGQVQQQRAAEVAAEVHGLVPRLQVIDFGDAGYGDPLYDFVAVMGSCLR